MSCTFNSEDEGKRVVTPDGCVVGSVVRVEDGDAHVRPRSGLLHGCGSWIASSWDETDAFRLDGRRVASVTADEIVLTTVPTGAHPPEPNQKK